MDILIIAVLIITAVILFLVELFVIPGISLAGISALGCIIYANYMLLQILEWWEDLSLWAYRLLPVSVH